MTAVIEALRDDKITIMPSVFQKPHSCPMEGLSSTAEYITEFNLRFY